MAMPTDDGGERPTGKPNAPGNSAGKPPLRVVLPSERGDRPEIKITPDVHLTSDAMAKALVPDAELFQRAGALTHVIRAQKDEFPGVSAGSPVTRNAPLSWLTDRVSRLARCIKWNGSIQKYVHVSPPSAQVRAVLERGSWSGIRTLRGLLEAPSLRPDGSVIQDAGYDAATGFLFEPNADYPRVPDAPTHSDCVLAYHHLLEPLKDFPFVAEAHRSATVAAILTLLARPAIMGSVPCWVFDAAAPRSGKSLLTDVISLVATGRPAGRMTYPEVDEELEKVMSAFAQRGVPAIWFDNVARPFGGAALDKCITAVDKVDMRVLGSSEIRSFDWIATVFASGNNVSFRGDMLARVLSPRLESSLENPETRDDMAIQDLRGWTLENRSRLAADALTILRGYVAAGRPDMGCARWGGFESWARLVPHALRWVGADDPMGARRGLRADEDPERLAAGALVEGWDRLCKQQATTTTGLTLKQALAVLYTKKRDPEEPDGHDELREAIETVTNAKPGMPPAPRALAEFIRRLKGRNVAGRRMVSAVVSGNVAKWRVVSVN